MRVILAILVLAVSTGCFTPDGGAATVTPPTNTTNSDSGNMSAMAPEAIALSLIDGPNAIQPGVPPQTMGISPSTLSLKVGMRYNLTVTNDGSTGHDLVIDGLDVATETLAPGESVTIEFTPVEAGDYPMYCSIGMPPVSHNDQGMHGTVTVA